MAFLIIHERSECTGCRSCHDLDPERWHMKRDGTSHLLGSSRNEEYEEILYCPPETFERSLEVAQSCPVNVIHIVRDNKRLL